MMKKFFLVAGLSATVFAAGEETHKGYLDREFALATKVGTADPVDATNCYPSGKGTLTANEDGTYNLKGITWAGNCAFMKDKDTQVLGPFTLTDPTLGLTYANIKSPFDVTVTPAEEGKTSTIKVTKTSFAHKVNEDKATDTVTWTITLDIDASKAEGAVPAYVDTVTLTGAGPIKCDKGTFLDTTDGTCKPCPATCETCTNLKTCQSCKADNYLPKTPTAEDNVCRACKTTAGEFLDATAKVCTPCSADNSCKTCTDATTCTACNNHFGLKTTDAKACTACELNQFTADDHKTCTPCPTACATCDSLKVCKTCNADKYLPKTPTAEDNVCRDCKTTAGEWLDATAKVCTACADHCATCDSATVCKTCSGHFGLKENGAEKLCKECAATEINQNNVCTACPARAFPDTDIHCQACTGRTIANNKACTPCDAGKFAKADNTCEACPAGKIVKDDNECHNCAGNQFIENHACVDCPQHCTACTDAATCTACADGFVVKAGKCEKKSSSTLIIIIVVIVLLVLAVVGFFLYRKKQADDLRASLVYKQANSSA